MKNKKNKIILIIILLLLLTGGAVFGYIYFATDLLKSDYELFEKTSEKNLNDIKTTLDCEDIEKYVKKKIKNNYEHNGDIKISANVSGMQFEDKILSYEGKQNIKEKAVEENIKLRYSDTENFSLKMIANNNILALGSDEIINVFIGIRNENLKQLAEKFGIKDVEEIPDSINEEEIKNIVKNRDNKELTKEDLVNIFNKYKKIINKQFVKEDFSKNEINNGNDIEYILTISEERLNQIFKAIIDALEKDETILNLLNEEQKEKFNEEIEDIKSEEDLFKDMEVKYIVSKSGKITIRINQIKLNQYIQFVVEKEDNKSLKITVSGKIEEEDIEIIVKLNNYIEEGKRKISLNIENKAFKTKMTLIFEDIETNEVKEKLLAEIEVVNAGEIKIEMTDKINYKEDVKIEKLNEENTFIINDKEKEETMDIITKVIEYGIELNKQKIEKAVEQAIKGKDNPGIIATIMAYSRLSNNSTIDTTPNFKID